MKRDTNLAAAGSELPGSPFSGTDVCALARLPLPADAQCPVFDHDVWNFEHVIGLPLQMKVGQRLFNFGAIHNPRWRQVAKEYIVAKLAPRHDLVRVLPNAYRHPMGLRTCVIRLQELTRLFNWLSDRAVPNMGDVDENLCDSYMEWRSHVRDEDGNPLRPAAKNRYMAAIVILDLVDYGDLFSTDRFSPGWRPWPGRTPAQIAGVETFKGENKTQPVPLDTLRPLLSAALYIVDTLGDHILLLRAELRENKQEVLAMPVMRDCPKEAVLAALDRHIAQKLPLVQLAEYVPVRDHNEDDPLRAVNLSSLAREAGARQFYTRWLSEGLRGPITRAVRLVGTEKPWGRIAALVPRADDGEMVPWTEPMFEKNARDQAGLLRVACLIVIAAVSGMRSSELMELRVGCRREDEIAPGLKRYRLLGKIIKGRDLGGEADEWVVVHEAHRAVAMAEQLVLEGNTLCPGDEVFGRFSFYDIFSRLARWVNSPAGVRLGLQPIPSGAVNLRMLRRTLAIELAYRPGGLLAAKLQLKQISVATTEGYAARPGGAQAKLLAEVTQHEQERNLILTEKEFHNFKRGVMPAGPGARELVEFFGSVDANLSSSASTAPKVLASDHELRNLLSRRAKTLHLGVANYCWFNDPSKALCLKAAGIQTATLPMIGMCDAARCPQATHHDQHREIWADAVESTTTFLGSLGKTHKTERSRLEAELARAQRVVDAIDAAHQEAKPQKAQP